MEPRTTTHLTPTHPAATHPTGEAIERRRRRNRRNKRRGPRPSAWRLWTAGGRALPDALIVGAQRAGTTSLFRYLAQHPAIATPIRKEVHYFDSEENWTRGERWYRAHFPRRADVPGRVVLEGTPAYMYRPDAAARMRALLPDAKLVAILRDPVERALSNWKLVAAWGGEYGPFELEVEHELCVLEGRPSPLEGLPPRGLLARGHYAEQLARLLAHYPREQLLVVDGGQLAPDPTACLRPVFEHLGLAPIEIASERVHNLSRDRRDMDPETRARLRAYFRPHDEALRELLGEDWA